MFSVRITMFVAVFVVADAQYPFLQQPGLLYPGQFPQPLQPSLGTGGENKEAICGLKSFAEIKCLSGSSSCKKCVVDQVSSKCSYNPASGSPDCEKLKSCAQGLTISCA